MHHTSYDSVMTKPVFFAASRKRGRILGATMGGILGLMVGLVVCSALSLVQSPELASPSQTGQLAASTVSPLKQGGSKVAKLAPKQLALLIEGGPNDETTPRVLDILAKFKIPATFVPTGHQALTESDLVQRIFAEGHEIGQSRRPTSIKATNLAEYLDAKSTLRIVEAVTGHSTRLQVDTANAPMSQMQVQPVIGAADPNGEYIVAAGDSRRTTLDRLGLDRSCVEVQAAKGGFVLVLTERAGQQLATILPQIITDLRGRGYSFTTLSGLLGKHREDVMPVVSSWLDRLYAKGNRLVLKLVRVGGSGDTWHDILEWTFAVGAFLAMLRTIFMVSFALLQNRRNQQIEDAVGDKNRDWGKVSVMIPAYNEVLAITNVITHVLSSNYHNLEVIMIDDGSTDETFAVAQKAFGNNPKVRLLRKPNGGKASALNYGLRFATGDFIVSIDGDTLMQADTISELLHKFVNPRVAAVAGCVKVANPRNLLTRWQEVEYMIGQNLDRQALEYVNGMNTVPGALGAFRREVIKEVGGYQPDTLAEDTDITIRILRRGYLVGYAPKAIAVTEAPETVKQLLRQRFRWSYGALQTVWKHRGAFLDSKCTGFAWFTLPQVMIFQLLLPFLVPLADVVLIASIAGGAGWDVVLYGLIFLAIDCAAAGVALVLAGEGKRLPYLSMMLVSQKFGYRYFVFVPLFKAFIAAIHGRAVGWGHLQRLGRVSQAAASAN